MSPSPANPRRMESLKSAAERLGVNVNTLRRLVATGELRVYHLGPRLLRVDINDVDNLLKW